MAKANKTPAPKNDETTIQVTIKGVAPHLQSNGQLSNPLNEYAREMKKVTKKKNKTESDYADLARLEFLGGLYQSAQYGVCVPGDNIDAMVQAGAAKRKQKTTFKACVFTTDPEFRLDYDGPRDPEKLWEDKRFVDMRAVCVNRKRIQRCRPIFNDWSLTFTLTLLSGAEVSVDDVREAVEAAGRLVGLSDFRPKFGRFVVEEFKVLN